METGSYAVKTAVFEGPFGVLLNMVEERKLFINDLTLAEVTEDYLKFVKSLEDRLPAQAAGSPLAVAARARRVGEISSFILVAATLILIKSKSLLPNLNLTSEEEGDIKDLEERLRLYEKFTKLAQKIKNNFGKRIIFAPLERKNEILVFLPDNQITRESMMGFAHEILGRLPKKTPLPEVEVKKVISIEEMINKLTERIQSALKISFWDFSGGKAKTKEEKVAVIVSFLAMLELVRQGIMDAVQEAHGQDIIIEKTN